MTSGNLLKRLLRTWMSRVVLTTFAVNTTVRSKMLPKTTSLLSSLSLRASWSEAQGWPWRRVSVSSPILVDLLIGLGPKSTFPLSASLTITDCGPCSAASRAKCLSTWSPASLRRVAVVARTEDRITSLATNLQSWSSNNSCEKEVYPQMQRKGASCGFKRSLSSNSAMPPYTSLFCGEVGDKMASSVMVSTGGGGGEITVQERCPGLPGSFVIEQS
mmetsp:Transcript_23281/g.54997  ORF Transcript_23281/g.54997 Transcript_23281/m.54997 type:complete len:217 (-) Transcript_23281:134-784(-)